MNKDILSGEYAEINNIIALAKADSEIEQILLSEISREFKNELEQKTEQIFYEDNVFEVLELAKHDKVKKVILIKAILQDNELTDLLINHFKELGTL